MIESNTHEILKFHHAANEQHSEWKTLGVKVRLADLPIINRQLSRLNYNTLGDSFITSLFGAE